MQREGRRLRLEGISKTYPGGVQANRGISLDLNRGEILGLVGENGAGKTTLMRILYGMELADEGKIVLDGRELELHKPNTAIAHGIGMVHQHFMLVPQFTGAVNIVLGAEPTTHRGLRFDEERAVRESRELAESFGMSIDLLSPVERLSVADQQRIEILKALYRGAEILILDEPTDVLTPQEVEPFFGIVKNFVADGKSVILVTHKLHEVFSYTDRIAVLRRGELVGVTPTGETDISGIVRQMVGTDRVHQYEERHKTVADTAENRLLEVEGLSVEIRDARAVRDVSFAVRRGEIVCIAGIEGNGQTELVEALTGLRGLRSGTVLLAGKEITAASVWARREAGMIHIPENRMTTGVCENLELTMNLAFGHHRRDYIADRGRWKEKKAQSFAKKLIEEFNIVASSPKVILGKLSGGNIQKTIVAREFSHSATRCAVVSQPTRGLDIRSVWYVHERLRELADEGIGLLVVSSDLDEVLAIADRILVLYGGEIAAEFSYGEADKEKLGYYMAGSHLAEKGASGDRQDPVNSSNISGKTEREGRGE